MTSPWDFRVGPEYDGTTDVLRKGLRQQLLDAVQARDEEAIRDLADDLDELDEIADRIRALMHGKHPDLLAMKNSSFTLPAPFTVRSITIGHWVVFFRIAEAPPPPHGWALGILPVNMPAKETQERLRSYK